MTFPLESWTPGYGVRPTSHGACPGCADRRRLLEQGDEAVVIYDLHTKPIPTAPVAEWYTVKSGKIASRQAFFDARPFAAMFEQQGA